MYGSDILCGISKGTFEIPHKISYSYIERCNFDTVLKFYEFLDLRTSKHFWNAPRTQPYAVSADALGRLFKGTEDGGGRRWGCLFRFVSFLFLLFNLVSF